MLMAHKAPVLAENDAAFLFTASNISSFSSYIIDRPFRSNKAHGAASSSKLSLNK